MEEDDSSLILGHKTQLLQTLISPVSSSTYKLSNKSRTIPSKKDFHFYNNFSEFKLPNNEVSSRVYSSLEALSSSSNIFGSKKQPTLPSDLDDSYDWLVNLNDEFIDNFNISLDEFKRERKKEEGELRNSELEGGGFQLVSNKKKKGRSMEKSGKDEGLGISNGVKIGLKEKEVAGAKSKAPFHIPTIPRPQREFNILVNNANTPFEHVWLERSEDGSRVVHPLEKLSVSDFIDRSIEEADMPKPLSLESTPFKLVEGLKELKEIATKLQDVSEFAVDLELNQYRSFQGLTCLRQISTRTEDFLIDTLKLYIHIGPYLREVFKEPLKRKVMHGADRDIEWLQRDFGIYVCNLFDTGQASRVLQLERNSLEYLLHHFCGVNANKEYQNADWRLRPLPDEMLKYGREDTHYLLHIYDLMRRRLLSASSDENDLLLEVYRRSYDLCVHLYQKELLTDTSFLYIYGLQEADFNSTQLSIASELHAWRDKVAREEDESTGYILPNKTLIEIAREMPVSYGKLRQLVKSRHSVIECHLNIVVNLIKRAIENSSSFDSIAGQLKEARLESIRQKIEDAGNNSKSMPGIGDPMDSTISQAGTPGISGNNENIEAATDDIVKPANAENFEGMSVDRYPNNKNTQAMSTPEIGCLLKMAAPVGTVRKQGMDNGNTGISPSNKKSSMSSVQILRKQTCSFGALLGNSASGRKLNPSSGRIYEQEKNGNKVEQKKSSVILNASRPNPADNGIKQNQPATTQQHITQPSSTTQSEEIVQLGGNSDVTLSSAESPNRENENGISNQGAQAAEDPISLWNLSASFELCFQKNRKKSQDTELNIEVMPFDYAAARKNIRFGDVKGNDGDEGVDGTTTGSREKPRGSVRSNGEERVRGLHRCASPTTYK